MGRVWPLMVTALLGWTRGSFSCACYMWVRWWHVALLFVAMPHLGLLCMLPEQWGRTCHLGYCFLLRIGVCGVVLSAHLFVGLHDSIISGVFVIHGMVMMGISSITLCSTSLFCWQKLFIPLCFFCGGSATSIAMMRSWSMRNTHLPLVVLFCNSSPFSEFIGEDV